VLRTRRARMVGIDTQLRVYPNHACATGAQHTEYHVVAGSGTVEARWERFNGW